jgi:hypothetical protein
MKRSPQITSATGKNGHAPYLPYAVSNREESENYRAIIAKLNAEWRVIECHDSIQWIVQRRAGMRHGEPRWDGRCYCRTRKGLLHRVRELTGECDALAIAIIGSLPDFMEGGQ